MPDNASNLPRRDLLRKGALLTGVFAAGGTALSGSAAAGRHGRRIRCGFIAFEEEVDQFRPVVYRLKVNGHQLVEIPLRNNENSDDNVDFSLDLGDGRFIGVSLSPGNGGRITQELGPGEYQFVVSTRDTATYTFLVECERLQGGNPNR